jgi:plastocyanin
MKHTGVLAGIVAVAAAGAFTVVGSAGAEQRAKVQAAATVYASDENGGCFTTDVALTCPSTPPVVNLTTGEAVDFAFPGNPANPNNRYNQPHNAVSNGANWTFVSHDASNDPVPPATTPNFNTAGDYEFVCGVHPFMTGTIHVTGPDITPTPTPTQSATPTPTPQPGGGNTPPPAAQPDAIRPTVRRMKLKALRRAARVTFRLSEPATVTIRVKKRKRVIASKRYQAQAGTRTVTLRSRKLKKGRYTLEILARDAAGNRSVAARKTLRITR